MTKYSVVDFLGEDSVAAEPSLWIKVEVRISSCFPLHVKSLIT